MNAAEFEGTTTPLIQRLCVAGTRSKGNSLELETKTYMFAYLIEYDLH